MIFFIVYSSRYSSFEDEWESFGRPTNRKVVGGSETAGYNL